MNVSVFKNVSGVKPIVSVPIDYVLQQIKSNTTKYYSNIVALRKTIYKSKEYNRIKQKTNIRTITWSGEFFKRNSSDLKKLSQHIYFDIDNINEDDFKEIKNYINEEPFVKSSWKSVGSKGFGFLVQFEGLTTSNFKTNYKYISDIFAEKDIQLDTLSDYARCNIISYDPDIYINNESEIIKALPKPKIVEKVIDYSKSISKDLSYKEQCLSVALAYTTKEKGNFIPGNRHYFTVCYAGVCNQFGISQTDAYFFLLDRGMSSDGVFKLIQDIYKAYSHQYCTKKLEKNEK